MDSQNYAENEVPEDGNVCHKGEKKTSVHGAPTPATIWLWVNIKQNCPSVTEMLHKYTAKTADENDGINTELQPNSVTIRTKRMDLAS
jgi:hypothetical protein